MSTLKGRTIVTVKVNLTTDDTAAVQAAAEDGRLLKVVEVFDDLQTARRKVSSGALGSGVFSVLNYMDRDQPVEIQQVTKVVVGTGEKGITRPRPTAKEEPQPEPTPTLAPPQAKG